MSNELSIYALIIISIICILAMVLDNRRNMSRAQLNDQRQQSIIRVTSLLFTAARKIERKKLDTNFNPAMTEFYSSEKQLLLSSLRNILNDLKKYKLEYEAKVVEKIWNDFNNLRTVAVLRAIIENPKNDLFVSLCLSNLDDIYEIIKQKQQGCGLYF